MAANADRSDYAAKVFGFQTFGRVYGCIIALSGVINLFQPAIDAMNHDVFHDNPIPLNIVFASLGSLFGISLVVYVIVQGRKVREEHEAQESQWEQYRTIREENESEYSVSVLNLSA